MSAAYNIFSKALWVGFWTKWDEFTKHRCVSVRTNNPFDLSSYCDVGINISTLLYIWTDLLNFQIDNWHAQSLIDSLSSGRGLLSLIPVTLPLLKCASFYENIRHNMKVFHLWEVKQSVRLKTLFVVCWELINAVESGQAEWTTPVGRGRSSRRPLSD